MNVLFGNIDVIEEAFVHESVIELVGEQEEGVEMARVKGRECEK